MEENSVSKKRKLIKSAVIEELDNAVYQPEVTYSKFTIV